jgi:hypothetical protein
MTTTRALNPRERTLIGAVADAFFPPNGPIPISGTEAGAVPYFERYIDRSGARSAFLMRLLIAFTDLSPIAFGTKRRRFTRLSRAEQIEHLHEAFMSQIYFRRVSFTSLRALMTMAYLSNDEVARHMNMVQDPDPFGMDRDDNAQSGARPAARSAGDEEGPASNSHASDELGVA